MCVVHLCISPASSCGLLYSLYSLLSTIYPLLSFKMNVMRPWNTEDLLHIVLCICDEEHEIQWICEVIYPVQDKIGWQKGLGMSEVGCKYPLGRWTCSPWTCGCSFVWPDQHHPSSSTLIMVFMSSGYTVWSADILAAAEKPLLATWTSFVLLNWAGDLRLASRSPWPLSFQRGTRTT